MNAWLYIRKMKIKSSCRFNLIYFNSIFLAKFDNNGSEIRVDDYSGQSQVDQFDVGFFPYDCNDGIGDIIPDEMGNIYITGTFFSTAQFGSYLLTADNGDVFIAKFTSD